MINFIYVLLAFICIAVDRISKIYISTHFEIGESLPVINDVFHITYYLNNGAAFSILKGRVSFLVCFTIIVLAAIVGFVILKKPKSKLLMVSITLIFSGAIGNLIDRMTTGQVVDFLDFTLINFPIFNFADCCVVVGAIVLCIYSFITPEDKKNVKA